MIKKPKILIIDDNEDILTAAALLFKQHDYFVQTENSPDQIPKLLTHSAFDVIFLDMNYTEDTTSGKEGMYWLKEIKRMANDTVVILITAYGDVNLAVDAMKAGAFDFILKPWQNEKVLATLSAALQLRDSQQEVYQLRSQQQILIEDRDKLFHDMIGESAKMKEVFSIIEKVAGTDASVLILGENGTGKELVARAIHRQSSRSDKVFISVDMGAIPDTLFESEFFGHVKGAFTDAKQDKPGRFEAASGGTLFLDEIGNLSMSSQSKLLRVLEEHKVTRLGQHHPVDIDIRLICATNMPLTQMVADKEFRQDFLFRINTVEIQLPSLRERLDDIPELANHFLAIYSKKYNKMYKPLNKDVIHHLKQYSWPGNIRELRHAIERAVIMSDSDHLTLSSFALTHNTQEIQIDSMSLEEIEKYLIQKTLNNCQHNISKSAEMLGLSRTALYRRLEKYHLK